MLLGDRAGALAVAAGDRADQRLLIAHEHGLLDLAQGEQLTDLRAQPRLLVGEPGGLRGGGDRDRQLGVRAPQVTRGGGRAQPLDLLLQALDLVRLRALGGELGGGAGDRPALIAEVAQLADAEALQRRAGVGGRLGEAAAAAAAAGDDQALAAQDRERLAQRDGGDAELGGELGFRRQALAVLQQPEADRVTEPAGDELRAAAGILQRREHRARDRCGQSDRCVVLYGRRHLDG